MNEDGSFQPFVVGNKSCVAKEFMDRVERLSRQGYFATDDLVQKQYGLDAMWYLWSGSQSLLFGKEKMATFERYFIADKSTYTAKRNAYYNLRDREDIARKILAEFGLNPDRAISSTATSRLRSRKGKIR
jgi:fructose-1,6-bisphosphatase-3